jgi:DNA polymerase-3 subunit delta
MTARQATIYPVYVISGKDIHLRAQTLQNLRNELLGDDQGIGEIRLDGKTVDLPTVLDELRTLAFLADRKVVVVDDADKFVTDYREELENYLNNPNSNGVLLLVCDSWRKGTKLDKLIARIGKVLLAETMTTQTLVPWLIEQAAALGKQLTHACANDLISVVGTESGRLINELEKLAMYVGDRKNINSPDIENICGPTAEESVFQITDLMTEGKSKEALHVFKRVLEMDKSAEFTMVGAMGYSLRRLLKARALIDSGISHREALAACNVYPKIAQRFIAQLNSLSARRLQSWIRRLAEIDLANKTGLGQARLNLEKFIICASSTLEK